MERLLVLNRKSDRPLSDRAAQKRGRLARSGHPHVGRLWGADLHQRTARNVRHIPSRETFSSTSSLTTQPPPPVRAGRGA